jgi:integrase
MASIRSNKRADGTVAHRVFFRHNGEQTCLTFDDRAIAEVLKSAIDQLGVDRALELHRIERKSRRHAGARSDKMTVHDWIDQHIDHLTGVEQYTIDQYRAYLRNDIDPTIGHIPIDELTEHDIGNWVKTLETTGGRKGEGQAPKTIKNKHGFLSAALGAAVPKYIPANPAAGRRLPRSHDGDERDMRMLSHDEFTLLLSKVTEPWRPLVEFLVASGCRWGEAVAIKPGDVDRAANTVKIRRAWKYSNTKGYYIGPVKTKRSKRTINVPKHILDQLDYSGEWLFLNRTGDPVRYHGFKRRVWDPAVKRSGLMPAPTPHDLRHTCASWALNRGIPVTVVSRHLGHESIKVTVDIYGDVDRTSAAAMADAMGEILTQ